jgi:cytochrome c oxidase cbb3-type subunit III
MTDAKRVDTPTGTEFVGHEWDGIEELDTPLPRWWLLIFIATIIFAAAYVVLFPAIPLRHSFTPGLLGWSSHGQLQAQLEAQTLSRAATTSAIAAMPVSQLPANPRLMAAGVEGGRSAFKANCVQCHGSGAAGGHGYPNLNDDDWLWGGSIAAIQRTIIDGIRAPGDDKTRFSQMPAFGEILKPTEIADLVAHVRVISHQQPASAASARGAVLFAANCAACHGPEGTGGRAFGAPNLTDAIWLYGGDAETLTATIAMSRYGIMPNWGHRLDAVTIKMLAAYVYSLGGGEPETPAEAAAASGAAMVSSPTAVVPAPVPAAAGQAADAKR